jgi:hypothetical protein
MAIVHQKSQQQQWFLRKKHVALKRNRDALIAEKNRPMTEK